MTHGGKSTVEPFQGYDDDQDYDDPQDGDGDQPTPLRWMTTGPWQWALGDFGTVRGCDGLPWIVDIPGRPQKLFRTLAAARRALENAATADAQEIVPDGHD
jgi:hypothetical protein